MNIDSAEMGIKIGIDRDFVVDYTNDGEGARLNYEVISAVIKQARCYAAPIDRSWKKRMEDIKTKNKYIECEVIMIYTQLTKKAMRIAYDAHKNQLDKSGVPYIYHPIHLAEQMTGEATVCVALLHDVAEDTDITLDDLRREGFGKEIMDALELMTHDENVPYMEYIRKIKDNPVAKKVKLADLAHNSDLTRLDNVDEYALKRVEKYRQAIDILNGKI